MTQTGGTLVENRYTASNYSSFAFCRQHYNLSEHLTQGVIQEPGLNIWHHGM